MHKMHEPQAIESRAMIGAISGQSFIHMSHRPTRSHVSNCAVSNRGPHLPGELHDLQPERNHSVHNHGLLSLVR